MISQLKAGHQNGLAHLTIQKRFVILYMGCCPMDRRFSESTMPWVMSEIKQRKNLSEVSLVVHGASIVAIDSVNPRSADITKAPKFLFEHKIKCLSRFVRLHNDPCCFGYLRRVYTPSDHYECHVFMSFDQYTVEDVFTAIRHASRDNTDLHRPANDLLTSGDNASSASYAFYEVLYMGRAKVTKKWLQSSDIDDLVDIIFRKVTEREQENDTRRRHASSTSVNSLPCNLDDTTIVQAELSHQRQSLNSHGDGESAGSSLEDSLGAACHGDTSSSEYIAEDADSDTVFTTEQNYGNFTPKRRNRTMLLKLGQDDIALISPDTKTSVMDITFQDIAYVSQGQAKLDMFGFVARDKNCDMVCHILQCCEKGVVGEIMKAFRVAFKSAYEVNKVEICPSCPLHQFHFLCRDIAGLSSQNAYEIVVKRVQQLSVDDIDFILNNDREDTATYCELLESVMIQTRILCEAKQKEHTHTKDTHSTHKMQFNLSSDNKCSKLDYFRNKAKKSLTTSFETILGHKKNEDGGHPQRRRHPSFDNFDRPVSHSDPESHRPRSNTMGAIPDYSHSVSLCDSSISEVNGDSSNVTKTKDVTGRCRHTSSNSSLKHIFLMTGSHKLSVDSESPVATEITPSISPTKTYPSWRQAIFNHVTTPVENSTFHFDKATTRDISCHNQTKNYRALWTKAILETIFLIRMEKEALDLKARKDDSALKQQKLEYDEVSPHNLDDVTNTWNAILKYDTALDIRYDVLKSAVKSGVVRHMRGAVWQLMIDQHRLTHPTLVQANSDVLDVTYDNLLTQLTTHQHSILIDLGRTFPGHPYFSHQLGCGQLALFNILKAYSLLDKEVGYCQGLSFVAGLLLMHMEEVEAFECLRYVMYILELRNQYKPDMVDLPAKLYQLTRLLHDNHKDLYDHFEAHDIVPVLYAAPWFLTLFASQFPLGFVARVFDLLLLDGIVVIFKVALVLLGDHKELIKQCTSFEAIVNFIKTTLPEMATIQTEKIINRVFDMEISQQLATYQVEYYMLQDEMIATPTPNTDNSHICDQIESLHANNVALKRLNMELVEKLQVANSHVHYLENTVHRHEENKLQLKSLIDTLELERAALLDTITKLKQTSPNIDPVSKISQPVSGVSQPVSETSRAVLVDKIVKPSLV